MYACYIFKNKTKPLYIQWNIFNSSFLGITFCELNRQVSCLCMLNWQISTILRLYLQFGWYRVTFHSGFDLNRFHCIKIVYNTNDIRFPLFVNFAPQCTSYCTILNCLSVCPPWIVHWIVCPSTYVFWFHHWYLQTEFLYDILLDDCIIMHACFLCITGIDSMHRDI
jgi:hypothetical protein